MSIDLRSSDTDLDFDDDSDEAEVLAEYRRALHRGEEVDVEEIVERGKIGYQFAKGVVTTPVAINLPIPTPPPQGQMINGSGVVKPFSPISGVLIPMSGTFHMPHITTGMLNPANGVWNETQLDEQQQKERWKNMGNKVLRHVNAHETSELGQLSDTVREKLQYLKDTASFSNAQWKAFAELTQSLNDMIGDPYDSGSVEPD